MLAALGLALDSLGFLVRVAGHNLGAKGMAGLDSLHCRWLNGPRLVIQDLMYQTTLRLVFALFVTLLEESMSYVDLVTCTRDIFICGYFTGTSTSWGPSVLSE